MAKPPATPPSSDIDGVDEDQQPIDVPENSLPERRKEGALRRQQEIGRPPVGGGKEESGR